MTASDKGRNREASWLSEYRDEDDEFALLALVKVQRAAA
jgi:hypothetical protein